METRMNSNAKRRYKAAAILLIGCWAADAQSYSSDPLGYSVPTPRPINPAESTTNPSALATQRQNPYLGSIPQTPTGTLLKLSLSEAMERGLHYNLGLVESEHASADVHGDRLRALAALRPELTASGRQTYESLSFKELGIRLPPNAPFQLPSTSGGFGYQDARVSVTQQVYNARLRDRYHAQKNAEEASILNQKDSRDVVVFAVATAYVQVIASAARVVTAQAQLDSAKELDKQTANRVTSEVSPEIDSLRAQVERQSAEQRLTNSKNQLEKNKLTLARITGLAIDQQFELTEKLSYQPPSNLTSETAIAEALRGRSDLASAGASVRAAEAALHSEKAQRLPVVSFSADYGGAGVNIGNFNSVYTVSGNVSVPIYTGGRIRADIEQARSDAARREAEYADLKGRIAYDVRVAWLDLTASDSGVTVATRNKALAEKALLQSRDRYSNGVTNYLEVVEAQEAVAAANDNYIQSLYSYNVAMISLARAMGGADTKLPQLLGGK
jgi:outer membrane protein TolC